ncbi:hypothetical protein CRG98_036368 [Punica granatum]|uniref:Uncharacterized protein n=1 Tax=Punica granatum TaxID=22663 RepID=A0A2I0IGZ7_PUNGR|nr:hypothetical protein CRG98_036368 [Punica granatum]
MEEIRRTIQNREGKQPSIIQDAYEIETDRFQCEPPAGSDSVFRFYAEDREATGEEAIMELGGGDGLHPVN